MSKKDFKIRLGKLEITMALITDSLALSDNGSQRAIGNWAELNAVEEIIKMKIPSLDECYNNLSILKDSQKHIENKIYKFQHQDNKPVNIYLYDVTSSYFEGKKNELSAFGYNRDGKKGKKQIVIGLLCDETGDPISIEVFKGNTNDLQTFSSVPTYLKTIV